MALVDYRLQNNVAVIKLDDGKANVLSFEMLEALSQALDRSLEESRAVLIIGRTGALSGGFDLKIMKAGPEELSRLVQTGAELLLRIYMFKHPTVVACPGHAVAAGALLLLASDLRIGVEGPFKIGLNEVAIGMPLPYFGVELARDRLARPWLARSVLQAELLDPRQATEAGFFDSVCQPDALRETALEAAERLTRLPGMSFQKTRNTLRSEISAQIRETLTEDIRAVARLMNPVESGS